MKTIKLLFAFVLFASAAAPAFAHEETFFATLNGVTEFPSNASPATGSALITFDLDLLTMHVQASFSGLTGTDTASHIHCCTATAGAAQNVGVATTTPTFTGFPLGVTSGTYDHTFDMALSSSYNPAFITANGGTVASAFSVLLTGIEAGEAYYNIHTSTFGGGEIRGFLQPVPEPSAWAMMAAGLGLLGCAARRRIRHN